MSETDYYTGEGYEEDAPQVYAPEAAPMEPIPVTMASARTPPEYGGCMTWTLTQAPGIPVQIAQRRIRRFKLKMVITNMGGATALTINSKQDPLMGSAPQGFTYGATTVPFVLPDWESQQPVYAIGTGGTPTIALWDEAYAER